MRRDRLTGMVSRPGGGRAIATARVRIGANTEGAQHTVAWSGGADFTSGSLFVTTNTNTAICSAVGLRFRDFPVPAGATVVSAKFLLWCSGNINQDDMDCVITGQVDNDPANFQTVQTLNPASRTRSAASVPWLALDQTGGVPAVVTSVDFSPVVQEVIGLTNYATYDPVVFFMTGTTTMPQRSFLVDHYPSIAIWKPCMDVSWYA